MIFSIPDSERVHQDLWRDGKAIFTGLVIELDQNIVSLERDLIVRATRVNIYGDISLPGRNVDIFAREIVVESEDPVTIDVSGSIGAPDFTGKAPALSGQRAGANGSSGRDGGEGKKGGNISLAAASLSGRLKLLANGGAGGKAQDGGNGARGANGSNAGGRNSGDVNGGNGGRGGAPGAPGTPGDGGDAGNIRVATLTTLEDGQIAAEATPGAAGASGRYGNPGGGGSRGLGQDFVYRVCEREGRIGGRGDF